LSPPTIDAVVVAAGSSRRMGGLDKLEALLAGRPVLAWAIAPLAAEPRIGRIVVVTALDRVERYRAAPWLSARVSAVVPGGDRRQDSVAAGVRWLQSNAPAPSQDSVVLVHDGARPAASTALVRQVIDAALRHGAAIPVMPIAESIKQLDDGLVAGTLDRSNLAVAQTPQAVRFALLDAAYRRFPPESAEVWTDEAALMEACTIPVHVVAGERGNLKVTLPHDLAWAEAALAGQWSARFGFGSDSHPFGPGRPLALGGIRLEEAPRLAGHSDGDVALHAVADALLGAMALGDLGRQFPAGASTPEDIPSPTLLAAVLERVATVGYRPRELDLTIVAARPVLGPRLEQMRGAIARLLGVETDAVSVKASTGNLAGMEGAGRGISAQAVVVVEPIR
jgi:2-C-methyl-D-erythritol 4-phosphate cytidylyltransferase/2-C-methyl-D-erythritol 2,4-cyclodiphosphate synthase